MNDKIDILLLQRSLQYHGKELQSNVLAEQGENFIPTTLQIISAGIPTSTTPLVPQNILLTVGKPIEDTSLGDDCQSKFMLSASDESRRKMLISFIAKKADMLFHKVDHKSIAPPFLNDVECKDHYGIVPPLEYFMDIDEEARKMHFYQSLQKDDIVVGSISGKHTHGLLVRLLCLAEGRAFYIHDLGIRCFCNVTQIPLRSAHEDPLTAYDVDDLIRGVVLDVQPHAQKIYISMKDAALSTALQQKCKLGLITEELLPHHYRTSHSLAS